jgi:hypothetical protein
MRRTISGSWAVATYWRLASIIGDAGLPTTVAPLGTVAHDARLGAAGEPPSSTAAARGRQDLVLRRSEIGGPP